MALSPPSVQAGRDPCRTHGEIWRYTVGILKEHLYPTKKTTIKSDGKSYFYADSHTAALTAVSCHLRTGHTRAHSRHSVLLLLSSTPGMDRPPSRL